VERADWGDAGLADIRAVLSAAAGEIWKHCPRTSLDAILVRPSKDVPITLFSRNEDGRIVIKLAVRDRLWARFAFQFSHEFCHALACQSNERKKQWQNTEHANQWFEESLCETVSLFALRSMAETWKTKPPYSNWKSYSPALSSYAADRLKDPKHQLPSGKSFQAWFRENEPSLRKESCDRDKNSIIAAQLLPLFERTQTGWEAMAYLNLGSRDLNKPFAKQLTEWRENCPAGLKPFVKEVAGVFGVALPAR